MRKKFLIFSVLMCCVSALFTSGAFAEARIFIDSASAEKAIKDTYGKMKTTHGKKYKIESSDSEILKDTLSEYNHMLSENGGFVTSSGLALVCAVPFYNFDPMADKGVTYADLTSLMNSTCQKFMRALRDVVPNQDCPYIVTSNTGAFQVKYTKKQGNTGFVRKCDNYVAWRFFNPGNLRDSADKCTTLETKKSGRFAVFPNEETGFKALEDLLRSEKSRTTKACGTFKYAALTAKEAIACFCPNGDRYNNSGKYVKDLANMGVDVDTKVLRNYTKQEMKVLMEAIAAIEGYYTGERVCPTPEHF